MEGLFDSFDTLPYRIGMTPIMRPYAIKSNHENQDVLSILTMIAESHISLHIFLYTREAYLDLFSCSFFDYSAVSEQLRQEFGGTVTNEILISRGSKYKLHRNEKEAQLVKSRNWLKNVNGIEIE
jgi:S-adenosylmethionine/arginine decarboxylase-like enzyme